MLENDTCGKCEYYLALEQSGIYNEPMGMCTISGIDEPASWVNVKRDLPACPRFVNKSGVAILNRAKQDLPRKVPEPVDMLQQAPCPAPRLSQPGNVISVGDEVEALIGETWMIIALTEHLAICRNKDGGETSFSLKDIRLRKC